MNESKVPALPVTPKKRLKPSKAEKDMTDAYRLWLAHPTSTYKLQRFVGHMVDFELAARLAPPASTPESPE
jgi:hypothetical protein